MVFYSFLLARSVCRREMSFGKRGIQTLTADSEKLTAGNAMRKEHPSLQRKRSKITLQ